MAIIQFKSDNPNFSYILMKNPSTGLTLRKYRMGTLFGYYSKDDIQTYNVFFRDGDDEVSFKKNQDEQYEHNDYKRYNSPMFIQGVVNDFFRQHITPNEAMEEDKKGFNNEIIIHQMYMFHPKYLDLIQKYFDDFEIIYSELNKGNYKVIVRTKNGTFRDCINMVYIISMFYHCIDKGTWIQSHEDEVVKYAKILNNVDAPYFLRYVVKYRVIKSINKFKKVKEELEKNSRYKIEMSYGDTQEQRADFIKDVIGEDKLEIVDIGCNTMSSYGFSLLRKLSKEDVFYHAIDINEEVIQRVEKKASINSLDNLITYQSLTEFIETENQNPVNIIMSEVFEHIKLVDDKKIIKKCLDKLKINKMIITTPDKRFNEFYLMSTEDKRLDDHVFEMVNTEFEEFFDTLMKPYEKTHKYTFRQLGDIVDGISSTQAVVIESI